jgi:membrane protein implicated in regulation of membrane protease activity
VTVLWWHWLLLGLLLLVVEVLSAGGFYIVFFGVGAMVVGTLVAFGLGGTLSTQVLLFVVVSVALLAFFRSRLLRRVQRDPQSPAVDPIVGEVGVAYELLAPGGMGRVELRGAGWTARNLGSAPLASGARCRVVGVDGLTLQVEPERSH